VNGLECHFTGRLGKDGDAPTWCTVLAFEDLTEKLAGLRKGAEVYARGKLKADLYTPQGGEPRVSLTLLTTHVEPLVLERKPPRPPQAHRKAVVYGAAEPFDDAL